MDKKTYEKKSSPCNCLNMRRASHAITEIYDDFLAPSNLTISQFSIIKHINYFGPLNVSELSTLMRLDRTTLVRNLKPLEKNGLVEDIATKGKRNRQLKLTDKGIATYKYSENLWQQAQKFFQEYLGKENMDIFTTLLLKIEELTP
nr:MarR family winged helix-turn-helix transcriptional regulator [uncultured Aminipila sp.]